MTEDRTSQRFSRLIRGMMEVPSEKSYEILIQNVSEHGIGARFSEEHLIAGTPVTVEIIGKDEYHGTVRWQKAGRIGIELTEELDPNSILFENDHLTAKQDGKYQVAIRFRPTTSTYRPGFGKK